jgi:predicted porin
MPRRPPALRRSSVLALGLAGVLLAPAAGAQSGSMIYGILLPNLDLVETVGATQGVPPDRPAQVDAAAYTGANQSRRLRMSGSTSNFGFRGFESLGGGNNVWFQIESAVGVDGDPPSGLATRNTGLGLEGPWGTLVAGQWDTPYKVPNIFTGSLRGSFQWEAANLVNTPGFNVPVTTTQSGRSNTKSDAAFNRRQGNAVQYWAPNVAGFSGRFMYALGEGRTAATPTTAAITPTIWSAAVTWQGEGLRVDYMHEQHSDYFGLAQIGGAPGATPTNAASSDYGNQVILTYKVADWRFVGTWERLTYTSDDTVQGNVERFAKDAWWVSVQPRFGPHQVWASYGQASAGSCERVGGLSCSTAGLGAKQWVVGWSYSLTKRTEVYGAYFQVINDASAQYTTLPPLFAAPGADTRGADIGVMHSF